MTDTSELTDIPRTTYLPKTTLALLTGTDENTARACGIFTKEDLMNIKLYVRHGLSLPVTEEEVAGHIGFSITDISGLTAADIMVLFKEIRLHALRWNTIENDVMLQNKSLMMTGENIVSVGSDIINIIAKMPLMERIQTEVSAMSKEKLAALHYSTDDHIVAGELISFMEAMQADIAVAQAHTLKIKTELSDFKIMLIGGELSNNMIVRGLEPQVRLKNNLMQSNNLKEVITELQHEIDEKQAQMEQLRKDYQQYAMMSLSGLIFGAIGITITAGIFGSRAEKARHEKNQLIALTRHLQDQCKNKKKLQITIETLTHYFQDMGIRMVDAEIAIGHLDLMWQFLLAEIKESQQQFTHINNALTLTSFVMEFQKIITPWKEVRDSTLCLSEVFDSALKEYKKHYEINALQREKMTMAAAVTSSAFNLIHYPAINVKELKKAIKNIFHVTIKNQEINTIEEKVMRVKVYARALDEDIQHIAASLLSALKHMPIQPYLASLAETACALADPKLSQHDKATLQAEQSGILTTLRNNISTGETVFSEHADRVASKITDLRSVVITGRFDDILTCQQHRQKELKLDRMQKIQNIEIIKKNRAKIIENQELVRKYNLVDIFKDYLPSSRDIDNINLTASKQEAIKQALKLSVDIIKKIAGTLSENLKYSDLADARQTLDRQINAHNREIKALDLAVQQTEQLIHDITAVLQLDVERSVVLIEADKLRQGWLLFVTELGAQKNVTMSELKLDRLLQEQIIFLKNLLQHYAAW